MDSYFVQWVDRQASVRPASEGKESRRNQIFSDRSMNVETQVVYEEIHKQDERIQRRDAAVRMDRFDVP